MTAVVTATEIQGMTEPESALYLAERFEGLRGRCPLPGGPSPVLTFRRMLQRFRAGCLVVRAREETNAA